MIIDTKKSHFDILKRTSFRAKIIEQGFCDIKIKVRTDKQIEWLTRLFEKYGIITIQYTFEKLKFWECWFPRYQYKKEIVF